MIIIHKFYFLGLNRLIKSANPIVFKIAEKNYFYVILLNRWRYYLIKIVKITIIYVILLHI